MTIHFFTKEDILPGCSRQRAFRVAEELRARGVDAVVHWPSAVLISTTRWPKKLNLIVAILRALRTIKKDDIVYLQRAISNKYFFCIMVMYLMVWRRKMIFDYDDAIYIHDHFKTKIFTCMADAVVVGSVVLADWARQYNSNVHIVNTSLKFATYKKFTKDYTKNSNPCVIGWIGTAKDHYRNLELLASVLEKLLKKTKIPFTFVVVGVLGHQKTMDLFNAIPGLPVMFVDRLEYSNAEAVPKSIQTFDIGTMPLTDRGEWNKARSSFKPLEYMACGVATICSTIGEVTHIIQDGKNGFLADSEDEWVEKLVKLLSDKKLRQTLGEAGQVRVQDNYCYEAIIPRMIDMFTSLQKK